MHESKWQTRWMSSSGIIHQAAVLSSSAWRWALKTSSYKSNEWFILFEVWFIVKIIIQLSWDLVIMFVSHDPDLQSAWVYMNWAVTFIIIIQAQECTVSSMANSCQVLFPPLFYSLLGISEGRSLGNYDFSVFKGQSPIVKFFSVLLGWKERERDWLCPLSLTIRRTKALGTPCEPERRDHLEHCQNDRVML